MADERRLSTIPCPACGQDETEQVPVWEDVVGYTDDRPPDYMGCVECNTMLPYDDWWPPNHTQEEES